jgi:Flp pilus assembly protein TadD
MPPSIRRIISASSNLVTEELQAQIDSANAAYRVGEYALALERFKEVADSHPDLAAGWYGIGMAQAALGNRIAADSAMARARLLAPDLPVAHPTEEAPPNPHP